MAEFWLFITMTFFNPNTQMLATDELSIGTFASKVECQDALTTEQHRLFQEYSTEIWEDKGYVPVDVKSFCVGE